MAITASNMNTSTGKSLIEKTNEVIAALKANGVMGLFGPELEIFDKHRKAYMTVAQAAIASGQADYIDEVKAAVEAGEKLTGGKFDAIVNSLSLALGSKDVLTTHNLTLCLKWVDGGVESVDFKDAEEADFLIEVECNYSRPSGIGKNLLRYVIGAIDRKEMDRLLTNSVVTKVRNFTKRVYTGGYQASIVKAGIVSAAEFPYEVVYEHYVTKLGERGHEPVASDWCGYIVDAIGVDVLYARNPYVPRLLVDSLLANLDSNYYNKTADLMGLTQYWPVLDEGERDTLRRRLVATAGVLNDPCQVELFDELGVDRSALEEVWKAHRQPKLEPELTNTVELEVDHTTIRTYDRTTNQTVSYPATRVQMGTGASTHGVLYSPLSVARDVSVTYSDYWSDYWSKTSEHGFYVAGDRLVLVDGFLPTHLTGSDPETHAIGGRRYARYSDLRTDKVACLPHDMKLATTILNSTDGKVQLDFVVVVKADADTSITEAEVRSYHKHLVDAVAALPHSRPEDEVRSLLSDMFARAKIHMVKAGDHISLGQFGHK